MNDKLISVKTWAEKMDMSVGHVKRMWPEWCVKYGIRTKKEGRARRFYLPDVEKMMMKGLSILILCFITFNCQAEQTGTASYYGAGERLNDNVAFKNLQFCEYLLEGASYQYPLGSVVKVTNLDNNKSIVIRIIDLGPAKRLGRLIDLNYFAFLQIANRKQGLIKVKVELVKTYNQRRKR